MALERTISIIFEGDDRSQEAFNSVSAGLGAVTGAVTAMTSPLAAAADAVLALEAGAAALAVGGLALAIHRAGEFNTATAEISTLVTDTAFDINQYRDSILSYAQSSTQSIADINSALYAAISAGSSWEDSIAAMSAAEQLAVAGKADLTSSTVLLMSTLNAYGAGVDEATRYSDVFFTTVRLGQTTMPELADSFARVSTLAASAGVPIETVAAAIAELTARGMPTAEAITAVRAAIQGIIDPTTQASQAAESMGLGFNASTLASQGFEGVLGAVYRATGGNIEQMAQLFTSVEALTVVAALFGNDGGNAFMEKLEEMRNSSGATAAAFALMVNNMELQNQRLVNTMEATAVLIGQRLVDDYGDLAQAISSIFTGLNISLDAGAFDQIFSLLEEFSGELSEFISGVAESLPDALNNVNFNGFTSSLRSLADQAVALLQGIFPEDLTTVDGLTHAIQRVVNAWTTLNNITSGIFEAWGPVFRAIGQLITDLGSADSTVYNFAQQIGNMLGSSQILDSLIERFGLLGAVAARTAIDGLDPAATSASDLNDTMNGLNYGMEDTRTLGEALRDAFRNFAGAAGTASDETNGLAGSIDELPDTASVSFEENGAADVSNAAGQVTRDVNAIPDEKVTAIGADPDTASMADSWGVMNQLIPGEKDTDVGANVGPTVAAAGDLINRAIPTERNTLAGANPNQPSIDAANNRLNALSAPRTANYTAQADELALERVRGQFETIQNAVEWEARLDIAEVEANADIVQSLADTLGSAFNSSADIITSAVDALSQLGSGFDLYGDQSFLRGVIEQELNLRERAMSATEALVNTQINYMEAKLEAMRRGEALIQIDGAGLQPHLEAFMWEILSAIQVRVNEEGHEMLFGIN